MQKQKFYIICIIHTNKSFSTTFDKGLEKNIKKKKKKRWRNQKT